MKSLNKQNQHSLNGTKQKYFLANPSVGRAFSRRRYLLLALLAVVLTVASLQAQTKLDINRATYQQITQLPVNEQLAQKLYDYIRFEGYLTSIYQLWDIPGMDAATFKKLKDRIAIVPVKQQSLVQERIEQIYYRLERWSSGEGINSDFVDLWIEKALEPLNINTISYEDLVNLQNVSPVDAVAILKQRQLIHWFRNSRDLRYTPGLSNYAYRSVRNFVQYSNTSLADWHGSILMRMDNTPFMAKDAEQSNVAQNLDLVENKETAANQLPAMYYKARFSKGKTIDFGLAYVRTVGEPMHYALTRPFHLPEMKFNITFKDLRWKDLLLRKLILGYYKVSFGQGIIMENTDFFMPRKSGYGFRKRFNGISGDLSRTREYALRGLAFEMNYHRLRGIGFVSYNNRDAILNRKKYDGCYSFNHFIVLNQRLNYTSGDTLRGPELSWLNSVKELTYGSHLQYTFAPGTFLGLSYYESAYNRYLDPDPYGIVGTDYKGQQNWDLRRTTADAEILQAYGGPVSRGSNPFWSKALSFRRVYGFNFQTVWRNIALQGEYGILDKSSQGFKLGAGPRAFVLSAYWQSETFNVLALYRNYDLGFDNPYQRSFSNYQRYKGTLFEKYYYLQSPLYGQLYLNNPQSQAEEGFFISTYYQMFRPLTFRMDYDNWMRKSDAAKHYRLVGTVDYRPVYPLDIQLRQKWQSREPQNAATPNRFYKNYEFRGRLRFRLSGYDALDVLYSNSKLIVHPRPRVFGDIVLDGEAISVNYAHNVNRYFRLSGMLTYYKGFLWNFEDTQFMVMDSRQGAFRYWFSVYSRLTSNLSVRLKYTADHHKPINNIQFQPYQSTIDANPGKKFAADWLRYDQNMFYLELNYNF